MIIHAFFISDSFNILVFSDNHQTWEVQGDPNLSYSIPNNGGKIFSAIDFVLGLNSMGGTNINDAILRALEIAKKVKDAEEISSKTEQLIIFLSDGEPTSGAVTGGDGGDGDRVAEGSRSNAAELILAAMAVGLQRKPLHMRGGALGKTVAWMTCGSVSVSLCWF